MINNPQVVRITNEVVRPTANRLAGLCDWTDQFVIRVLTPEILAPLGISMEILAGETMPSEEDFPDEVVDDGASIDGRPVATRRKLLALIRVIYQLKTIKDTPVYGIPHYTEAVAYALASNPGA